MYVHRLDTACALLSRTAYETFRAQNHFPRPPFHHVQIRTLECIYLDISAHFHWLHHDIFSQNLHINVGDLHTRPASSAPLFSFICACSKCRAAKNPSISACAQSRILHFSATITCNYDHFRRFCKIWQSQINFSRINTGQLFDMMFSLRFFIVSLQFNIQASSI